MAVPFRLFLLLIFLSVHIYAANFSALCLETLAKLTAADPSIANDSSYVCDAVYSPFSPPASVIYVTLDVCLAASPGFQPSKTTKLSEWVTPFVSFLVPSLGFIFFIPREWNMTEWVRRLDKERHWFLANVVMSGSLVIFVLDLLLGYAVVFAWAGSSIAGAIYEAFIDAAALDEVRQIRREGRDRTDEVGMSERLTVAITLVGSFKHDAMDERHGSTLSDIVLSELRRDGRSFLRRLCSSVNSFGVQIGIPMLFYLGAMLYGMVDAESRKGDNDTAHSIAFGLWYFVIVIVAVVSSLVLGVVAPKALEAVLNDYHAGHTAFKLRWLDERRMQLSEWSRVSVVGLDGVMVPVLAPRIAKIFRRRFVRRSCVIAGVILAFPCGLAIVVAYTTPEPGFSCRSTTVLTYLVVQELLIVLWFFHSSPRLTRLKVEAGLALKTPAGDPGYRILFLMLSTISFLYHFVGALSVVITVGGTIMQLVGVYRNCVCKAGLYWGLPTTKNWAAGQIKLSTDNLADREAAAIWMVCGGIGVAGVALLCLVGASHSLRMRQRCMNVIDELYEAEDIENSQPVVEGIELDSLGGDPQQSGVEADVQVSDTTPLTSQPADTETVKKPAGSVT